MKIISYILSPIFALVFFLLLVIFHPIQWLGLKIFGKKGHQRVVNIMNWFLIKSLLLLGIPVRCEYKYELPKNTSLIFVSNHQSTFDIPPIIWFFRKHLPKHKIFKKCLFMCFPIRTDTTPPSLQPI